MGLSTPSRACLYSEIRSNRQLVMYQNCCAIDAIVETMTERDIKEMSVAAVSIEVYGKCPVVQGKGKAYNSNARCGRNA